MKFLKRLLFFYKTPHKNIFKIEKKINYKFKDSSILTTALTHRSYTSIPEKNYERLEFLGDSILDYIISEWLFKKYKKLDEGQLTKKRASLVNRNFLGMLGQKFNLVNYILIDSSVNIKDQKVLQNISADIYESLVGAIFLDGGEKAAIKFIYDTLIKYNKEANENLNYKGKLIEYSHENGLNSPKFNLIDSKGPDHKRIFRSRVELSNGKKYDGIGQTKKSAEQNAAKIALKKMQIN